MSYNLTQPFQIGIIIGFNYFQLICWDLLDMSRPRHREPPRSVKTHPRAEENRWPRNRRLLPRKKFWCRATSSGWMDDGWCENGWLMIDDDDTSEFHKIHIIVLNMSIFWSPLPRLRRVRTCKAIVHRRFAVRTLGWSSWGMWNPSLPGEVKLKFRIPSTKNVHTYIYIYIIYIICIYIWSQWWLLPWKGELPKSFGGTYITIIIRYWWLEFYMIMIND